MPQFGETKTAQAQAQFSERVRRWRQARGWTQADLAERSGFARSTLSKIENGQLSPTFEVLLKLSHGFEVTVSALMALDDGPQIIGRMSVDRGDDRQSLDYDNHRLRPLASQLKGRKFESFVVDFICTDLAAFGEWNSHDTEDMLFVLSGILEFHSEAYEPLRLSPGQSIQFDGRMRHACLAVGKEPCRCLYVCAR